jgi:hypothetical protein
MPRSQPRFDDDALVELGDPAGAVDGLDVGGFDAGLAFAVEADADRAHERDDDEQDHAEQTDADAAEERARAPVASEPPSGHRGPLLCGGF